MKLAPHFKLIVIYKGKWALCYKSEYLYCFLNEAPGQVMTLPLSRRILFNVLPTSLTKKQSVPCALREQCLFKRSLFFHFHNNLHFSSTDSLRLNGSYLAIQTRSTSNAFLLQLFRYIHPVMLFFFFFFFFQYYQNINSSEIFLQALLLKVLTAEKHTRGAVN